MKASTKRYAALFTFAIAADLAANIYITVGLDGNFSVFSPNDLWNFTEYSWDLGVFCLLRITFVLLALTTSSIVGSEKFYKRNNGSASPWTCLSNCCVKQTQRDTPLNSPTNGDYAALSGTDINSTGEKVSIVMDNSFEHEYSATIKVPLGPGVSRGKITVMRQQQKLDVKKVCNCGQTK